MTDTHSQKSTQSLVIPPDVQAKFGQVVQLIVESESMNNDERQYWINILPVMTPDQVKNLVEILTNEKKQLAAIDAKYSGSSESENGAPPQKRIEDIDAERRLKREQRAKAEQEHNALEKNSEQSILESIQNM